MFFCGETGGLEFPDGLLLSAGMSAAELQAQATDGLHFAGAHSVSGVPFSVECRFVDGALCAVTLRPLVGNAARRRAALFEALSIADARPDSRALTRVAAPFGEVTIASEPYFCRAEARIEYARKNKGADSD